MWKAAHSHGLQCGCMHLDRTRVKNTIIIIPFQIKLFDFSNEVAATVKLDFNTLLQPSSFYLPAHLCKLFNCDEAQFCWKHSQKHSQINPIISSLPGFTSPNPLPSRLEAKLNRAMHFSHQNKSVGFRLMTAGVWVGGRCLHAWTWIWNLIEMSNCKVSALCVPCARWLLSKHSRRKHGMQRWDWLSDLFWLPTVSLKQTLKYLIALPKSLEWLCTRTGQHKGLLDLLQIAFTGREKSLISIRAWNGILMNEKSLFS